VIAYPDEESLRDLIAGPSIIACGFATREELKQRSTLTSGRPPLGNELAEDLLSSELRNIHAELFR
jgi:hypothetical protein